MAQYQLPDGSYLNADTAARDVQTPDGVFVNQAVVTILSAAGTASGAGSASGVGATALVRAGTATGSGAASGVTTTIKSVVGNASGAGSASGVGSFLSGITRSAAGTARGHGTAVGISPRESGVVDTAFVNWARRSNAQRVVLVELDYVYESSGTPTTGTLYMANKFYVAESGVTGSSHTITTNYFVESFTGAAGPYDGANPDVGGAYTNDGSSDYTVDVIRTGTGFGYGDSTDPYQISVFSSTLTFPFTMEVQFKLVSAMSYVNASIDFAVQHTGTPNVWLVNPYFYFDNGGTETWHYKTFWDDGVTGGSTDHDLGSGFLPDVLHLCKVDVSNTDIKAYVDGTLLDTIPYTTALSADQVDWGAEDDAGGAVLIDFLKVYTVTTTTSGGSSDPVPYRECIDTVGNFQRTLTGPTLGTFQSSLGSVTINNANHEYDDILRLALDNSPVRVYLGDASWDRSDFRLMFEAFSVKASAPSEDKIEISLKDASALFDKSIGGDVLVGGTGPSAQQFRAANFGFLRQVPLQLIDSSTLLYCHSDTGDGVVARQVYDRGLELGPSGFNDNANGTVTLLASPEGQLTADIMAVLPTSGPGDYTQRKVSDAFFEFVSDRAGFGVAGRYAGAGPTFTVGDADDYPVGVSLTSATNIPQSLLPTLAQSGNCFWAILRTGSFTFGRLRPNSIVDFGLTPININFDDIDATTLKEDKLALPTYYRLQALINKNWFVASDIAGAVGPERQAELRNEGLVLQQGDSVGTTYADAPELYDLSLVPSPVINTWVSGSDADGDDSVAIGTEWMEKQRELYLPWLQGISFTTGIEFYELELGDVVNLALPWFGCQDGVLFQVVSVNLKPDKGKVDLTLVRRYAAEDVPPDFTRTTESNLNIAFAVGTPPTPPPPPPPVPPPPTPAPSVPPSDVTPWITYSSGANPYVDRLQNSRARYVVPPAVQSFGAGNTHTVAMTYDAAYMVVGVPWDISGGGNASGIGSGIVYVYKRQSDGTYLQVATLTRPSSDPTTGTQTWGDIVDINDELDIFVGCTSIGSGNTNSNARIFTYTGSDTWDSGTDLGFSYCFWAHFNKWSAAGAWGTTYMLVVHEGWSGTSAIPAISSVHIWRKSGGAWTDQQTLSMYNPGTFLFANDAAITFDGRSIALLLDGNDGTNNIATVELWQTSDSILWSSAQHFQVGPTDRADGGPVEPGQTSCIAMSYDARVIAISVGNFGVYRSGTYYSGVYIYRAEGTALWPIVGTYTKKATLLGDDTVSIGSIALTLDGQFLAIGQPHTNSGAVMAGAVYGVNRVQSITGDTFITSYAHGYTFANDSGTVADGEFGSCVAMDMNGRRVIANRYQASGTGDLVTVFENRLDDLIAGITNDDFANAIDITPGVPVIDGLLNAVKYFAGGWERGETVASVGYKGMGPSLWYKVSPLVNVVFSIDAMKSLTVLDPFYKNESPKLPNTTIGIYTGTDVTSLTEVYANDDHSGSPTTVGNSSDQYLSDINEVTLTALTDYYIRVMPYGLSNVDNPLLQLRYSYRVVIIWDTFTDPDDTVVTTGHTGEVGASWTVVPTFGPGASDEYLIKANALSRPIFPQPDSSGEALMYASGSVGSNTRFMIQLWFTFNGSLIPSGDGSFTAVYEKCDSAPSWVFGFSVRMFGPGGGGGGTEIDVSTDGGSTLAAWFTFVDNRVYRADVTVDGTNMSLQVVDTVTNTNMLGSPVTWTRAAAPRDQLGINMFGDGAGQSSVPEIRVWA